MQNRVFGPLGMTSVGFGGTGGPPMMNVLRDIAGVELPDYVGRITDEGNAAAPTSATPTVPAATATADADSASTTKRSKG